MDKNCFGHFNKEEEQCAYCDARKDCIESMWGGDARAAEH